MTYKAFVTAHPNPILQQSDETVQSSVYNWFKYRYIGFSDEDKFLDILQRNVSINYPIYKQKLRIEPGVAQYDWLVSEYRERQLKVTGTTGSTRTHGADTVTTSGESSGTETTTRDLTDTTARTGSQTDAKTGTDTLTRQTDSTATKGGNTTVTDDITDTHTKTGSDTTSDSGTVSHAKTGTDTTLDTGTDTVTKTGTVTVADSKDSTATRTGGYTETDTAGLHTTTTSPHVKTVTSHDNDTSAFAGNQSIQSALPLSKSYTTFIEPDDATSSTASSGVSGTQQYQHAYQHMPALDWTTATAQAQDGHREYGNDTGTTTTSYTYDDGVEGDVQTTQGDADNPDTKTVTYNSDATTTKETGSSTTTNDTTDTDTKSLSHATTYGAKDEETRALTGGTTYNTTDTDTKAGTSKTVYDIVDTTNGTQTDSTEYGSSSTLTYNSVTDTRTSGGTEGSQTTGKESGTTQSVYGDIADSASNEQTDREQVTGRNEAPAELLARATAFIEKSSAFMWLKEQLDSCFYPGYYTDEDCNDEEYGSAFI